MTLYIVLFALLFAISLALGVVYVTRRRREAAGRDQPSSLAPVALDRNPEMPHRPGATS